MRAAPWELRRKQLHNLLPELEMLRRDRPPTDLEGGAVATRSVTCRAGGEACAASGYLAGAPR